jgi:hypothetical protein
LKRTQLAAIQDMQNAHVKQMREERKRHSDAFLERLREEWRRGCDDGALQYHARAFYGVNQNVPTNVLIRLNDYTELSLSQRQQALIDAARLLDEAMVSSDEFYKERMASEEEARRIGEQNQGKVIMIRVAAVFLLLVAWGTPVALGIIAYQTGRNGFKVAAGIAVVIFIIGMGVASGGNPRPVLDPHDHANL